MKKITIKEKMILSNILMIIIPIISFSILLLLGLSIVDIGRWDTIESIYESNTNTYSAQNILLGYKELILKGNKDENKYLEKMSNELSSLGYHMTICKNSEYIYNSLTEDEENNIDKIVTEEVDNLLVENDGESIIFISFKNNSDSYDLIAYTNDNQVNNGGNVKISLITLVMILFVLMILIVIITNLVLSSWLTKTILNPLEKLKIGSREIKAGNLNYKIDYENKDEFGEVCEDFNKMQEKLKESDEARKEYEKKRKEIIRGVSHDLRTPLTAIKGYVEGLQDGIANTEEKKEKYYKVIETRVKDIENLIDTLASLEDIEKQNKKSMELVDLDDYIKRIMNDYEEEFTKNKVKVRYQGKKNIQVMINREEFKRVFDNLIENTFKYCQNKKKEIYVKLKSDEKIVQIIYKDNGEGVKDEELKNIFAEFYRGDKARTNPENGSGLGLAIVKRIVENCNGTIEAQNNDGLEFVITLPKGEI